MRNWWKACSAQGIPPTFETTFSISFLRLAFASGGVGWPKTPIAKPFTESASGICVRIVRCCQLTVLLDGIGHESFVLAHEEIVFVPLLNKPL